LKLEESSNRYGQDAYRQIEPAFDSAQRQINAEIEKWYYRFAKNNQITIEEAKRQLSAKELKEFQWDVNEYIKYGRENAINQQWMKELENASARVHVSRLEALKIRTQQAAEVAFGNELDVIDDMARKVYTEDYYRTIFEMQKGFNIGWDIGTIDPKKLDKLVVKPWAADGKNFKDRIWNSKNQMVSELHQQLTRACVLGKAPDEAIESLTKYVDKDIKNKKYAAGRLVMTEQAYFHAAAQKDAFSELDVEKVEIVATLDSHTSTICQDMDGQIVEMKDYEPGVTVPPFHVFCRSVTVPYFDDNFGGERAARDKDGNTYYVPDDMTYKEWSKEYVADAEHIQYSNIANDTEQFERYKSVLKEISPNSLEKFKEIKYNNGDEWKTLKHQYRIVNQYKVDSGEVSVQKILDMDESIIKDKRNNFPSKYKTSGNIAGAYINNDETMFIAHSKVDDITDNGFKNYKGTSNLVLLQDKLAFKYIDVLNQDGSVRTNTFFDTEAKLFEEFHLLSQSRDISEITMLSERGMCESCINVMEQFKKTHPNIKVNVISNKKVNSDVWGNRLRSQEWYENKKGRKKK
jgi:SPP1 gp7 family putative phage head morphogenesis protein